MPINSVRLGPGTLKLGTTPGTEYGCQVQSLSLEPDKEEGDPISTLCGDSVPGAITYTWSLTGTLLQDYATGGISQYCWTNMGQAVAFEFTPNTAATAKYVGSVIIDPLAFGSSDGEFGDVLTADIEWSVVGKPTPTWPTTQEAMAEEPAA